MGSGASLVPRACAPWTESSWRCIEPPIVEARTRSPSSPWISNRNSVARAMPPRIWNETSAPITDNTGNRQLVGRSQWDRLAGALQRDVITLADGEGRKLAELSQAIAQSIDLVATDDRHQISAVVNIRLISAIDRLAPVRSATDHCRRQDAAEIAFGHQVLGIIDRRRHLALQTDHVADPPASGRVEHCHCLIGVTAARPFAIDMLSGLK